MNRDIRRVGIGVLVLFLAVVAQLTYLQVLHAKNLQNNPNNVRAFIRDVNRPRGPIVSSDGVVLAQSLKSSGEVTQQRQYPTQGLFAHVVGYQSLVYGTVGVEHTYNDALVGRDLRVGLSQLLSGTPNTGTVVLTLNAKAQQAARDALAGHHGSVVALDVQTGAVLVMYSEPTFDPNVLANHNTKNVQTFQNALLDIPANPELARAWRERYPAGSTFKVVTAALALEAGLAPPTRQFPRLKELPLPQTTQTLKNFGLERCGGNIEESFTVSCNTTFGQLGLDLGEQLAQGMARFGINTAPPPVDVNPPVIASLGPQVGTFANNKPLFAQAAIGQNSVEVTPLEMAMIAQSVADGGKMMLPHVLSEVRDTSTNRTVRTFHPSVWRVTMRPDTAATLTQYMIDVVQRGTGTGAQIPGVQVAGKTGTAQVEGKAPHAWFIAFAPADHPRFAISVLVENGGSLQNEATGGRVAAPIAADVLRVLLNSGA
jgi:peptidoglycan glycosyltransferase